MKITLFWEDGHTEECNGIGGIVGVSHLNRRYSSYVIENTKGFDHDNPVDMNRFLDFIDTLNAGLEKKAEKPPIGLRPKTIADMERKKEIRDAINRYLKDGKEIPEKWVDEYNGIRVEI